MLKLLPLVLVAWCQYPSRRQLHLLSEMYWEKLYILSRLKRSVIMQLLVLVACFNIQILSYYCLKYHNWRVSLWTMLEWTLCYSCFLRYTKFFVCEIITMDRWIRHLYTALYQIINLISLQFIINLRYKMMSCLTTLNLIGLFRLLQSKADPGPNSMICLSINHSFWDSIYIIFFNVTF